MAQDPKYQIKIVKAGIGDPLLTVQFQFTNSDGTFDVPTNENPVFNLAVSGRLTWLNQEGESQGADIGTVTVWRVATANIYNLTLPFDEPDGFGMGSDVTMTLQGSASSAEITFFNGSGNQASSALTFYDGGTPYQDLYVQYEYAVS